MISTALPARMNAVRIAAPGRAPETVRLPVPTPAPGQYLVRVEACGVCHSDLHIRRGDENLPPEAYPLVLGHEGIGRIVAGEGPLPVGTRVGLPWVHETCLDCRPCRTGRETYCPDQRVRGLDLPGAFAEYAVLSTRFAVPVPDGIDPVRGAPLLCAGLTAWAALERCTVRAGARLLVVGAGGLGQHAVEIGRARGLRVAVVDTDPAKRSGALALGASLAVDADGVEAVRAWGGADIVLNFAPTPAVWDLIAGVVNPLSEVVAVALVHDPVPLSMMWLIDGGHRVMGSSVGTRADVQALLGFAAEFPSAVPVEAVPLGAVAEALDRLERGEVAGRLVVDLSLG